MFPGESNLPDRRFARRVVYNKITSYAPVRHVQHDYWLLTTDFRHNDFVRTAAIVLRINLDKALNQNLNTGRLVNRNVSVLDISPYKNPYSYMYTGHLNWRFSKLHLTNGSKLMYLTCRRRPSANNIQLKCLLSLDKY